MAVLAQGLAKSTGEGHEMKRILISAPCSPEALRDFAQACGCVVKWVQPDKRLRRDEETAVLVRRMERVRENMERFVEE